ncbi:hypothetical protein QTQ03_29215 [Micromonospora sp. WMMA1363]|uniref:hypothetical protein n=1 Tax=Micromonospora sp. WMMA1363 TaxID=3053985 RepID=UPI00259D02A3|nr:hypothetical protein [Micromonospora sp. WMMA1363]MDM4723464.1 hypothetical protein [Micromonospora sp. WMMA1363]
MLVEPSLQVSIYLDRDAAAAAKRLSAARTVTYATIVMDAIDVAIDSDMLEQVVRDRQIVERPAGSRFPPRRASRRPSRNVGGPSRVLWPVQLTNSELAVLEDLVGQVGAASRSALVSAAVEWYIQLPRVRRMSGQ